MECARLVAAIESIKTQRYSTNVITILSKIQRRFTFGVVIVIAHYLAWRGAVILIHHGPVEGFSTNLFFNLFALRWYVVAAVSLYSIYLRFFSTKRQWDIYGPPLALLSSASMYLEIQKYV
jgi:hypothetical protein